METLEMKNTIIKISSVHKPDRRMAITEESSSKHEDRTIEITYSEQREKRLGEK